MSHIGRRAAAGVVVAIVFTAAVIQLGVGNAFGVARKEPEATMAPAPRVSAFTVLGRPHGNRIVIGTGVEWCPTDGEARGLPRLSGVKQVDTPKAVILTAYLVARPATCLVEAFAERTVRIRGGGLHGRVLLDGSVSPPKRRWPR